MIKSKIKNIFKCKHHNPEIKSMTCYSTNGMKEIYVEYECKCGYTFTKNTSQYLKSVAKKLHVK